MSSQSIQSGYTTWSATYDTDHNLTRDLDQIVTRAMLSERHYGSIIEIGCGTGKNTQLLVRIGDHVHALDFSEGMLAQARAKGLGPNVTFTQTDITQQWPCADSSADLATCNLVLEHVADLEFVFGEAARILLPGGQFFICELHPFKQYLGSKATFQHDQSRVELPAFVHHISDFLDAAQQHGFSLVSLKEWWHDDDQHTPPRLISFLFEK